MKEFKEILFDEETIAKKVKELGGRISADYTGKELLIVSILRGAVVFTADLMRSLSVPAEIEFVHASSYGDATVSSGRIRLKKDIEADIRGRHVLLADCIIDTGETMDFLMKKFRERGPASLEAVVLLDKKIRRTVDVPVKYVGFEIPDRFVVGYGLDFAQRHRCLPYVAVMQEMSKDP